jgi:nucleotide-binding universal stress UspA family protein
MQNFKSILCPIDFSGFSDTAVGFAAKLATAESVIHLCHGIHPPLTIDPYGYQLIDSKLEDVKNNAMQTMEEKVAQIKAKYPTCTFASHIDVQTDTAHGIIEAAEAVQADVIVIASHGRKGLKRLLMGSVAESVMRTATCPVLLVKAH